MSILNEILEDQHSEAIKDPGRTIVRKLYRGLRVEMTAESLNSIRLAITRDNTFPSSQEWQTIYKHLPFWAEKQEPQRIIERGRYILTATMRPVNQIKFL